MYTETLTNIEVEDLGSDIATGEIHLDPDLAPARGIIFCCSFGAIFWSVVGYFLFI